MKNFTLDSFKDQLFEFYNSPSESSREFVGVTGIQGATVIDNMIMRIAASDISDRLKANNLLSEEEHINLNKMIDSPDKENLMVAIAIMEQREKHE